MKKVMVCQHVPYEPLGTLNPLIKRSGTRIRYINFGRNPNQKPTLDGYHGLILLGGPMSANQFGRYPHLRTEIGLIETALDQNLPIRGICLGAQLLGKTLGRRIRKVSTPEIGWYQLQRAESEDTLLKDFTDRKTLFQWHWDTFDLPARGTRLASSRHCSNQAFRYGSSAYGFQFHMEADRRLTQRWVNLPEHQQERVSGFYNVESIINETGLHRKRKLQLSQLTFSRFLKLLGPIRNKRLHLPSR